MNERHCVKRVFLVGCPRSGTTLLRSILAAHPQVITLRETHFFKLVVPSRFRWARALGLAARSAPGAFNWLIQSLPDRQYERFRPRVGLFVRAYAAAFVKILDSYALENNKSVWIEKTPSHVHRIDDIVRYIPDARFIHLIRSGPDVVASLFDVTRKYPDQWWHGPWELDRCIDQWINDVRASMRYWGRPGHAFITYEDLTDNPRAEASRLCDFLELPFDERMLDEYNAKARQRAQTGQYVGMHEKILGPIRSYNNTTFYKIFDEAQREYVRERLSVVHLDHLWKQRVPVGESS